MFEAGVVSISSIWVLACIIVCLFAVFGSGLVVSSSVRFPYNDGPSWTPTVPRWLFPEKKSGNGAFQAPDEGWSPDKFAGVFLEDGARAYSAADTDERAREGLKALNDLEQYIERATRATAARKDLLRAAEQTTSGRARGGENE